MKRFLNYLKRVYRFSLNKSKREDLAWKDLKKFFAKFDWKYGIYEKEKYIDSFWSITDADDKGTKFIYLINDNCFYCSANAFDNYPIELTTEIFILAQHFNNVLKNGIVIVDAESRYVEYRRKMDILIPLLNTGVFLEEIIHHQETVIDIHWAFQKLVEENEAPAIIFADFLKKKQEEAIQDENKV